MTQRILYARNEYPGVQIVCPICFMASRYEAGFIEDAIRDHNDIVCVACQEAFEIRLDWPARDAQQRNEADQAGARMSDAVAISGRCGHPRFKFLNAVAVCRYCGDPNYIDNGVVGSA